MAAKCFTAQPLILPGMARMSLIVALWAELCEFQASLIYMTVPGSLGDTVRLI